MTTYKEILGGVPQKLTSKFQIYYPMILNLLSDSIEYEEFVKKSMLSLELESMENGLRTQIAELETDLSEKKDGFETVKTPIEILQEFHDLNKSLEMASNKKRKEVDKKIAELIKSNPTVSKDIVYFREYESLKIGLQKKIRELDSTSQYIENQIHNVIRVLRKREIVHEDSYTLTDVKGQICRQIAEVNPVLMTEILVGLNDFAEFEPIHLVGFLSVFTDVRVPNGEDVGPNNCSGCGLVNDRIRDLNRICDSLIQDEEEVRIYSGENMDSFSYTIVDDVMDWCLCKDEGECRLLLQRLGEDKGVSAGDFTKAILKISTVARELISVCDNMGKIDLMNRLSKIDGLILKHVSTNQSLYL
jgi:superfamily II RNA helicase